MSILIESTRKIGILNEKREVQILKDLENIKFSLDDNKKTLDELINSSTYEEARSIVASMAMLSMDKRKNPQTLSDMKKYGIKILKDRIRDRERQLKDMQKLVDRVNKNYDRVYYKIVNVLKKSYDIRRSENGYEIAIIVDNPTEDSVDEVDELLNRSMSLKPSDRYYRSNVRSYSLFNLKAYTYLGIRFFFGLKKYQVDSPRILLFFDSNPYELEPDFYGFHAH